MLGIFCWVCGDEVGCWGEFIGPSVDVCEEMAESCGGSFDTESVPLDEGGVSLTGEIGESRFAEPDESFVRFFLRNPRLGMGGEASVSCSSTGIPRRDL